MRALVGVLGYPVAHSRSPAMHNAAFRELGLDWHYVKLPVPPARFAEVVRSLPASGYRGANVTIPHKRAALALADTSTWAARGIGAANMLSFDGGGIEAENTDARGFLLALDAPVAGRRAQVLGAGGAARAVVWALHQAGAREVLVWNRTPENSAELTDELGGHAVARPESADVLVNATSVGLERGVGIDEALASLALTRVDPAPLVVDLVYRPGGTTPVITWAKRAGVRVVDGLEVLVRQGALSFERWTGEKAPLAVMRAAARGVD